MHYILSYSDFFLYWCLTYIYEDIFVLHIYVAVTSPYPSGRGVTKMISHLGLLMYSVLFLKFSVYERLSNRFKIFFTDIDVLFQFPHEWHNLHHNLDQYILSNYIIYIIFRAINCETSWVFYWYHDYEVYTMINNMIYIIIYTMINKFAQFTPKLTSLNNLHHK